MEINKKILKIGLVMILLSLIISMSFSMFIKLKNPVFFINYIDNPYYMENDKYSDCELILHYITNVNDDRYITDITFVEAPEMDVVTDNYGFGIAYSSLHYDSRESIFGRYKINTIYLKLDLNNISSDIENLELNNAKIFFDNGDNLNVDIGKVKFYEYDHDDEFLNSFGSGGSSDGTGYMECKVNKEITLVKLESSFVSYLKDSIEIKIDDNNYKDIEGIKYKEGSNLKLNYNTNNKKDSKSQYIIYNISPKLYFQDKDGNIISKRLGKITENYRRFEFWDILKYFHARGEI